jgi:signal transduction histidine kinase/ActR/RegA family two-component response regulator
MDRWRAETVGPLIALDFSCAVLVSVVLTALGYGLPGYGAALAVGWTLVALLGALQVARGMPWRWRAAGLLALNFGAMLIFASSLRPNAMAFTHAVAIVTLAGLLLGTRASLVAAGLVGAAIAAVATATAWTPPRPPLPGGREWLAEIAGSLPPFVLVVVALHRILGRLGDAFGATVDALRDLQATRTQLVETERAELVGRLAGALAHDLNNTLTVVTANAEWLEDRLVGDGEASEAAGQIHEAARNAAALTQQVLLASRRGMAQPRPLDLTRATAAAASALRRLLPPSIQVEARPAPEVWTHADPGQVQQVILGLALNARTAMPGGGTLILAVRAEPRAGGPPAAVLEVTDTGFGLDAESRRRAFEPLSARAGGDRGAGLGLAGVKHVVEENGGEIALRSVPGAGTVVTVALPGAAVPGAAAPSQARRRRARVLVVEDDIRIRALVCTTLAEAGHTVDEVADGTQAMRAIEELEGSVDLLVTDLVMPGVPVAEVIATFRARHPGGRVLVCSAYTDDEALRRRVFAGEYHLLAKPFTRTDLLAAVDVVLGAAALDAEAGGGQPLAVGRTVAHPP